MKEMTTKELKKKIIAGEKLNIIDVREKAEIASGKIPNAVHIPLIDIPNSLQAFDQMKHYYIICHSGGRSSNACRFLSQKGYEVTNIAGGMLDWDGELE